MTSITVKFAGGLRQDSGEASHTPAFPESATIADLVPRVRALGLDLDTEKNIVALNQRGLDQGLPDCLLGSEDVVIASPHIAGGQRG